MIDLLYIFNDVETNGLIGLLFRFAALAVFVVVLILSIQQFRTKREYAFKSVMTMIASLAIVTLSLPIYQQYLKSAGLNYLFLTPYANIVSSVGVFIISMGFLYLYTRKR